MSKKRTNKGLLVLAALAALLLALGLAACGGGDDTSASGGSTEAESTEAETGGEEGGGEEPVSIAMEEILTGVAFGQEIKQGIEAYAAEDPNASVEVQGPPSTEPEVAQKQATDMLAKNPDAFGFAPFPPELWTRTAQNIWDQVGPNVLTFNERPTSEVDTVSTSPVQTFVGTADTSEAREILEKTIELAELPESFTGEVILGQCVAQEAGVLAQRTDGFEEALAKLLPNAKVDKFTSEVEPQANTKAWTTKLAAQPNAELAIGTCDQDGTSLYKVKKEKGYDLIVGAMELPPETVAGLKDGSIIAAVGTNWWLQGYTATRMLAEAARGAELPEGWVNTGYKFYTGDSIAEIEERSNEPEKFFAADVEELFGAGMPTAEPIEGAFE